MDELLWWVIAYSAKASLLCVATLLVLASCRRVSASVRSGIVVAGTVGAIILPLTAGLLPPISLSSLFPQSARAEISLEGMSPTKESQTGLVGHQVEPEVLEQLGAASASGAGEAGLATGWGALAWVWVGGVLISFVLLAGRLVAVSRLRSRSRTVAAGHPLILETQTASLAAGCRSVPAVRVSDRVKVPSAIGLGFGTVVVPAGFSELPPPARHAVLVHECTHLRRRDSFMQVLISLCRCLHWFNPLFLALDRAFNAEAEKACDDRVIASGIAPDEYSETILHYYQAAVAASPAGVWNGAASGFYPCPRLDSKLRGRKRMILARIQRMVDPGARRTALGAVFGGFLVAVSSASATVLGALVLVPDYEWRYQLSERHLPYANQLVACWRMDEIQSGKTPDAGARYDGAVVGGTLDQAGQLDKAIYFDGDGFVDMGDHFGGLEYPITLSAWVRPDPSERGNQNVVWLGGGGGDKYLGIGVHFGQAKITSRHGQVHGLRAEEKFFGESWRHITGVFVSENERLLYVDGELVARDDRPAKKPDTSRLQVGRNGRLNNETSYVRGAIDDVRVYQAALDQAAIREIMKGDFALIAVRGSR